jgi:hypothetical protein
MHFLKSFGLESVKRKVMAGFHVRLSRPMLLLSMVSTANQWDSVALAICYSDASEAFKGRHLRLL